VPLTERDRHAAYEALQQAFGDHTDAVIELLRPDHDRLATKDDLALAVADLRSEIGDVRTEMADLRTELRTEMANLRAEFHHDIREAFSAQTRTLLIGLISAVILIALSNTLAVVAG
jgi:hypothetical protein